MNFELAFLEIAPYPLRLMPEEDNQEPILRLKRLCNASNIHALTAVATFMLIRPGRTQSAIAAMTGQSASNVGEWIPWFELNGLITVGEAPPKRAKPIALTEEGETLRAAINALFVP